MIVVIRGRDLFADEDPGSVHVMRIRDAVRGEPPRKPSKMNALAIIAVIVILLYIVHAVR